MELLHRHSGLKQGLIAERFGDWDMSRARGAIREKVETEPKIRKWFQDLTRLSTLRNGSRKFKKLERRREESRIAVTSHLGDV